MVTLALLVRRGGHGRRLDRGNGGNIVGISCLRRRGQGWEYQL